MKKILNGVEVDLTPDEEAEYNQRQADWDAQAPQRLQDLCVLSLNNFIEDTAKAKQYGSAVSCASYVSSSNPAWKAEADAFVAWRDACWEYAFDYFARSQNGDIPSPSIEDFMGGVVAIVWP